MSLEDLDFADALSSSVEPTRGTLQASQLQDFASDAAFEAAKGSAGADGDAYINTSDSRIHYYATTWKKGAEVDNPVFEDSTDDTKEIALDASGQTTGARTTVAGTATTNRTITIPDATDTLVGRATADVLTNKDIDGGTATNTSRLTIPKEDTAALTALTRKQGTLVYDTDEDKLKFDDGTDLQDVGTGAGGGAGGINYLTDSDTDFEVSVGNYITFDDGAVSEPIDGTGGAPSVITITRETTTPLVGDGMLRIAHAAFDGQGEGTSVPFTAENAFIDSVNKVEFLYNLSTPGSFITGADSTIQVFLYDVTNAALVPLSNEDIESSSGKFRATFVGTGSSSYRLIFHCTETGASAWNLDIDNVVCGPNSDVRGVPATDSIAYTPTITGFGTVTNNSAFYWRVGDKLFARGFFNVATPTATPGLIGLPSGLAIDTGKLPSTNADETHLGIAFAQRTAATKMFNSESSFALAYDGVNADSFQVYEESSGQTFNSTDANVAVSSGDGFTWELDGVPISGWSSDVSMANGSTFRMSNILANGSRVTADPVKLGEWRSQLRNAGAGTFTDTNGSPTTLPSSADGVQIYDGNAFTAADTNNEPTRYKFFIGVQKHYRVEWYDAVGKVNSSGIGPDAISTTEDLGYFVSYDPTSGILQVAAHRSQGGAVDHTGARDSTGGVLAHPYFDIVVSENAQAVGIEVPRSMVRVHTAAAYGTNANIRKFSTIVDNVGTAITLTQDASDDRFTINEPGIYTISYNDNYSVANDLGLSLNSSQLSTAIGTITAADRLAITTTSANSFSENISWTGILSKGDIIRAHTNAGVSGSAALTSLTITQVSK